MAGEILVNLVNHDIFAKIFLANIQSDAPKIYLAYVLSVAYSPNFLTNSLYLYGWPKFSRVATVLVLKYF